MSQTRFATLSLREMSPSEFFNYAQTRIQYLEDRAKYYQDSPDIDQLFREVRTLIALAEEKAINISDLEQSYEL